MINRFILTTFFLLFIISTVVAQRGKDNDVTITTANTIVNIYKRVTDDIAAGTSTINLENTNDIAVGDYVLIMQMQGMEIHDGVNWWNGQYSTGEVLGYPAELQGVYTHLFGKPGYLGNAGKYEFAEVLSKTTSTVTFNCGLVNNYTFSMKVQVVKIPRYKNLTISGAGSIVAQAWNGTTGGVVAIEVAETMSLNPTNPATPCINASALGFRGGQVVTGGGTDNNPPHTNPTGAGNVWLNSTMTLLPPSFKGENLYGDVERMEEIASPKGRSPMTNGGGGGGQQNAGGGGGSNVASLELIETQTGRGIKPAGESAAVWALEQGNSPLVYWPENTVGGGRGGHTYANQVNNNPEVHGPNTNAWGASKRKENGGLGGWGLAYDATRAYLGGGGGAGHDDSNQGGSGGNGGGAVFVISYGAITGSGTIAARGGDGKQSNPDLQAPTYSGRKGNDGAGGGGGGGVIIVKNMQALPSSITLDVTGGNGGDFKLRRGSTFVSAELGGPGGGGQGGYVVLSTGTNSAVITGGREGRAMINTGTSSESVNSPLTYTAILAGMPSNGATAGSSGYRAPNNPFYNITVPPKAVCGSGSVTLTVETQGTVPAGTSYTWYNSMTSTTALATGSSYTIANVTTTTTYWVKVCPANYRIPVTVTVNPRPQITGTAVLTNPTCNVAGSITGLTATGGSNLTYSWNNGANTANLTNVTAGTYTLTVTNEEGCSTNSNAYVLTGVGGPTLITHPTITAQNCNGNGSLSGMVVNTTVAVQSITMNGNVVTSLNQSVPAGAYTFVVTDINGCTATFGPYQVNYLADPIITGNPIVTDENCNQLGTISGLAASGSSTLTYSWNGAAYATIDASDLTAGSYTLTVTDENGCTAMSGPYIVAQAPVPSITGEAVITQPSCLVGGSITGLFGTGGVGTLTYSWSNTTANTSSVYGINAGSYILTVTDANGCTATSGPHVLIAPSQPTIAGTAVVNPITCNGPGTITGLSIVGGTAPFVYMYNSTINGSIDLSTNTPGNYTLNVGDANGCIVTSGPYIITEITPPSINGLTVISDQTCNELGQVGITSVTGGQAPYTLLWSDNTSTGNTAQVAAGTYALTVTDNLGCSVTSASVTVNLITPPNLDETNASLINIPCQGVGGVNGILVTGGTAPLTYTWNGVTSANENLTTTTPGNYTLTVTDANGCEINSSTFTLTVVGGPTIGTAEVTPITCASSGSINNIQISGGTQPYTVQWNTNNAAAPYNITVTQPGTYTINVTDANGCLATRSFQMDAPVGIVISGMPVITDQTCNSLGSINGLTYTSNGTITYAGYSNGGTQSPYLANGLDGISANSMLPGGSYMLILRDANGCEATYGPMVVGSADVPIFAVNPNVIQPSCTEGGAIRDYQITGGTAPYGFNWSPSNSTDMFLENLEPGTYVLTVTDAVGCTLEQTFTLVAPPMPIISNEANITNQSCTSFGSITGISIAGSQALPFQYSWSNGASTADLLNVPAGSYVLTVIDVDGCEATRQFTVGSNVVGEVNISYQPNPAIINVNTVFQANTSTPVLGVYSWQIGGVNYITSGNVIDSMFMQGGIVPVIVTVQTVEGCVLTDSITIQIYTDLVIPNVITANGDDVNDTFFLGALLPNTYVLILDRWGNVVFESDNYTNNWKGTDKKGNPVMDGVYTYLIKTAAGEQYHGFVTVVDAQK